MGVNKSKRYRDSRIRRFHMIKAWNLVDQETQDKYLNKSVTLMGVEGVIEAFNENGVQITWIGVDDEFLTGTVTYPNVSVSLEQLNLL